MRSALLSLPLLLASAAVAHAQQIAVNSVGYLPFAAKIAVVSGAGAADSFRVMRGNEVVLRGALSAAISDAATGRSVRRADLSRLRQAGEYTVRVSGVPDSDPFVVSPDAYRATAGAALKSFYLQRCGTALLPQHAGFYYHGVCHLTDGVFHSTADTSGRKDVAGGWHDAGDYNKYVVNAGITVGTMLMGYELAPERFSADTLNIPESGNGVPDLLDEVRWELEWFFKVQRTEGGVAHKVSRKQFEGFVMPHRDNTEIRSIYAIGSAATGDFAAVMARAARIYRPFDPAFADRCLEAAQRAWVFLATSPGIVPTGGFKNPADTGTGEYGDGDDRDERLWAAAELFVTTGDAVYANAYAALSNSSSGLTHAPYWGDVGPMGHLAYLTGPQPAASPSVRSALRSSLVQTCRQMAQQINASGYRVALAPGEYTWGSNSGALNKAMLLLVAARESAADRSAFLAAAADQLHYALGVNGFARSYVTGFGARPPRYPHHRPSAADENAEPVPGLIVGGPNQFNWPHAAVAPALSWEDVQGNYFVNETAINWNAPLVFVAGYLATEPALTTAAAEEAPRPGGRFRLAPASPNPFNPATVIGFDLPTAGSVRLEVFDALGRKVRTLVDARRSAGAHEATFDASGLPSGVYLVRLSTGDAVATQRLTLVR